MNLTEVGVICLNREIREECQNCLWLEWDSVNHCCCNAKTPICPLCQAQLFWLTPYFTPPRFPF